MQAQLTEQQAQLSQQHQDQQNAENSHIVVSTLALIPISGCMHSVVLSFPDKCCILQVTPARDVIIEACSKLQLIDAWRSPVQTIREFERQLADAQSEAQRLERENENLEGQAEQLAISLMDATSKKTDSELRLRQLQQVRPRLPFPCTPRQPEA